MPNNSASSENKENSNTETNNTPSNRVAINIRNAAHSTYYRAFASTDRHERRTLLIYEVKPLQDSNVHGTTWRR